MHGFGEHPVGRALLDDPTEVKHDDPVAEPAYGGEVVRDEHEAALAFRSERPDQVEHLRLHGDVERGRRFVQYDQLGVDDERTRYNHPLRLSAGELARPAVQDLRPQAGLQHSLLGPHPPLFLAEPEHPQRFADGVEHRTPWAQRSLRVLEHHLHASVQLPALGPQHLGQLRALDLHRARGNRLQAGDHARQSALAAAALADDADALAVRDGDRDVV